MWKPYHYVLAPFILKCFIIQRNLMKVRRCREIALEEKEELF